MSGAVLWFAEVFAMVLVLGSPHANERQKGFLLVINLDGNFAGNEAGFGEKENKQSSYREHSAY